MSALPIISAFGGDLTANDYVNLGARWISRELADAAGIRRVDSITGSQMCGRKRGDCSGLIIPNVFPGESHPREYRLRLDHPDLQYRSDGSIREVNRYLQPPGRANQVYFPVGVTIEMLANADLPVSITEGEFKAVALGRLASHATESPRFLSLAVSGVWNWRGIVGKAEGSNGGRRDVKGVLPDIDRVTWKGRRVIIAFDADAEQKSGVRAARWHLAATLRERGAIVGNLEWPIEEGKGIDDRLANVGPDRVLADIAGVQYGDWREHLLRNEDGKIIPCHENVALYLENSPEWSAVLAHNEFTGAFTVLKQPPAPVTAAAGSEIEDHFDTEVVRWLERKRLMVKPDMVRRTVDVVARRNAFHPVRDYLRSLPSWDGKPRIGSWLVDYCGVDSSDTNPNCYAAAVGEKFLVAAIARVEDPGCKVDSLLILEGAQGIGKSTAARILAGEYFTDQLADLGSKDASMQLRGAWFVELSELDALNRTEMARAKSFISQQQERFRLPYGRRIVQVPRQCVFVGTTNQEAWLKDETGGRRFWPVRCHRIDLDGLRRDRDQLWAEATARYRAGTTWWLDDADLIQHAREEQQARYQDDVWHGKVVEFAELEAGLPLSAPRCSASIPEILSRLGVEMSRQDQASANRVARCLKVAGWERYKSGPRAAREWRYRKAVSQ